MFSKIGFVTLALGLGFNAHALTVTDIDHLSNARLEALTSTIAPLADAPAFGNCAPKLRRVKATDLGNEILENAINTYISDLDEARGFHYDFGLLITTESTPEAVTNSLLAVVESDADAATVATLNGLAQAIAPIVAENPRIELKSGTAVYKMKSPSREEQIVMRVLADKEANEFLLFGSGVCTP